MACIKRKFVGSASEPTFCDTRAAIGTADTPAEPIKGFTFPLVAQHMILPNNTPAAVPMAKATRPRTTIFNVVGTRKFAPLVLAPTDVPSRITTIYINALDAVSASCFTTPDSLNRLPSISIPTNGAVLGSKRHTTTVTTIGNKILSSLETGRSCSILISLSFFVVRSLMIGG